MREPQAIIWQSWGGAFIAFHRPSGSTHLLNASSAQLLQSILVNPQSIDGVIERFAESEPDSGDGSMRAELHEMLAHLEQLGFVEQI